MMSFTSSEQEELYKLGFNEDYMEFVYPHDDFSCYKSYEHLYHVLYDGEDIEVTNFEDLVVKVKNIIGEIK